MRSLACDAEMPWGMCSEEDDRLLAEGKPPAASATHCHTRCRHRLMEIHSVLDDGQGEPIALFAMISAIDQRKELSRPIVSSSCCSAAC